MASRRWGGYSMRGATYRVAAPPPTRNASHSGAYRRPPLPWAWTSVSRRATGKRSSFW